MTCPAPHHLDAYVEGGLDGPAAERVRQHVAACPACESEIALAQKIDGVLAEGRAVCAPEGLVEAALAEAHRRAPARPASATDRAPVRHRRRSRLFTAVALAAAAVVAVATTWATLDAPRTQPEAPLVAEHVTPTPDVAPPAALPPAEATPPEPVEALNPVPEPPGSRAAERRPLPAPAGPAPADVPAEPIAEAAPADDPTPEEVEQAKDDLQLAFALVADAQRQAGRALREEAGPLVSALDHTLPF